ncbi:MAG: VOC family protein [Erythrobacter sp.]
MAVLHIVPNVAADDVATLRQFYVDLFRLEVKAELDWFAALVTSTDSPTRINIAQHGGSGAPVADISFEVDDVEATYERAQQLGSKILYELKDEPWGVRRFNVIDPAGKRLNIYAQI